MTSQNATRVGPVHFQSLEEELRPVILYLSGHMLNAGCGSRDVTPYLLANGVTGVTKYDIASEDAEVVVGPAVRDRLEADPSYVLKHGHTYSGHPTVCAAALANLDVLRDEALLERAPKIGGRRASG